MEKKIVAFENKSHRRLLGITKNNKRYRKRENCVTGWKLYSSPRNSQKTEIMLVRPHHSTQLVSHNDSSR